MPSRRESPCMTPSSATVTAVLYQLMLSINGIVVLPEAASRPIFTVYRRTHHKRIVASREIIGNRLVGRRFILTLRHRPYTLCPVSPDLLKGAWDAHTLSPYEKAGLSQSGDSSGTIPAKPRKLCQSLQGDRPLFETIHEKVHGIYKDVAHFGCRPGGGGPDLIALG